MKAIRSKSGIIQLMLDTGKPIIVDENDNATVDGKKVLVAAVHALWVDNILGSPEYGLYELLSYGRATTVGEVMETRIDYSVTGAAHPYNAELVRLLAWWPPRYVYPLGWIDTWSLHRCT